MWSRGEGETLDHAMQTIFEKIEMFFYHFYWLKYHVNAYIKTQKAHTFSHVTDRMEIENLYTWFTHVIQDQFNDWTMHSCLQK